MSCAAAERTLQYMYMSQSTLTHWPTKMPSTDQHESVIASDHEPSYTDYKGSSDLRGSLAKPSIHIHYIRPSLP